MLDTLLLIMQPFIVILVFDLHYNSQVYLINIVLEV